MRENHIQFMANEDTLDRLSQYPNKHLAAKRDLEIYYRVLDHEWGKLAKKFTRNELCLLNDVLCKWGTYRRAEIRPAGLFWAEVRYSIQAHDLDAVWKVDTGPLLCKLEELTTIGVLALIDYLRRCYHENNNL